MERSQLLEIRNVVGMNLRGEKVGNVEIVGDDVSLDEVSRFVSLEELQLAVVLELLESVVLRPGVAIAREEHCIDSAATEPIRFGVASYWDQSRHGLDVNHHFRWQQSCMFADKTFVRTFKMA